MPVIPEEALADAGAREKHSLEPESLVLVIMTGGTICMKRSPSGLIPERGFLEKAMSPRPEFNDGLNHPPLEVRTGDEEIPQKLRSLRTPLTTYGKRVR